MGDTEMLFGDWEPWADPEMVAYRRLPMRTPITAHVGLEEARVGDRTASPWWRPLDGEWSARRWPHPRNVPRSAVQMGADTSDWHTVRVPGNWTLQGLGDAPHYTNIVMPWSGQPPHLPEAIPTVVHRRTFDVPAQWEGRGVILHIGGAESVHGVWVNGRLVGWGTDSRLASDFSISGIRHFGPCDYLGHDDWGH